MKNKYCTILMLLLICLQFSSCSSVYVDYPEISVKYSMEVDPNEEYFTPGDVLYKSPRANSRLYDGVWIYTEIQEFDRYVRTLSDGTKYYTKDRAVRLVKYNPETGEVSSLCLDPVCNHSPGSECIMLAPENSLVSLQLLVGNWLTFSYGVKDDDFGNLQIAYAYNLKTGETIDIFKYDLKELVATTYTGRYVFGNKLYTTMNKLDYTNTGFKPGGDLPLSEFDPETRSYLYVLDFDTQKETELFEVPANYVLMAVTNRRYFFVSEDGDCYSCDLEGNNMKIEKNLNFSPQELCGTYCYKFDYDKRIINMYDLRTDQAKEIPMESSYQKYYLTNEGIVCSTFSTADERYAEAIRSGDPARINKVRHEGTALIYLMDYDFSNPELIFEKERTGIDIYFINDKYFFTQTTTIDPDNPTIRIDYQNHGRHVINRETGEITSVPYLDIVIPDE